jgi:hypothetical protein
MVALDPATAVTGIETSPAALTLPALTFDEMKVSPAAGSTRTLPSL